MVMSIIFYLAPIELVVNNLPPSTNPTDEFGVPLLITMMNEIKMID